MERLCFLAVLLTLSSSAHAGRSFSFNLGKHRVHVEAGSHCHSLSCASVSVSRRVNWRQRRDHYQDERDTAVPARPAPAVPQTVSPPVSPPPTFPKAVVDASPAPITTASAPKTYSADPPRPAPQVQEVPIEVPPARPAAEVAPVEPAPQVERVLHKMEEETPASDSPIGDWQTEGKGRVRIGKCGDALCGFALGPANEIGEAILINMKPKKEKHWTGGIYSQTSGDTYYGTMSMKGLDTLYVEACAVGRFYCSGNNWSRITRRADGLMTLRQTSFDFRS